MIRRACMFEHRHSHGGRIKDFFADGHAEMQMSATFQEALWVVQHPANGQVQAIEFGARRRTQGFKNIHGAQCVGWSEQRVLAARVNLPSALR